MNYHEPEFTSYDIECIAWIWKIAHLGLERMYDEDETPDYVFEELLSLKERVIQLIKQRTMS